MRNVKAIYECNCEVPLPEGNYKGTWQGNSIKFQVEIEGKPTPCEIKATENQSNLAVMVVVLGPYIYVYKQMDLKKK